MENTHCEKFIKNLPKAELHVHIEGTMEPDQLRLFAERNNVIVPPGTLTSDGTRYTFSDLSSFIDAYLQATLVLQNQQDFYDLTWAYLKKIAHQGAVHTEIFFDLQTYMPRSIGPEIIINGIHNALVDGEKEFGISGSLIMCIIRHLNEESGFKALELAHPYKDKIVGIGLASLEENNPSSKYERIFDHARAQGYHLVAHVAETSGNGAALIHQALRVLKVERIDHGVGCSDDQKMIRELAQKKIPLTICPLSNIALGYYTTIEQHPLKKMFDAGVITTINSDDPAFFGGYLADNYQAAADGMGFSCAELVTCARYSFEASFMTAAEKIRCLQKLEAYAAGHVCMSSI